MSIFMIAHTFGDDKNVSFRPSPNFRALSQRFNYNFKIFQVESIAGSLLQNMYDIYSEPDPELVKHAIQTFLEECEPDVPYKQILVRFFLN